MFLSLAEQGGAFTPELREKSGIGVLARGVTGWGEK